MTIPQLKRLERRPNLNQHFTLRLRVSAEHKGLNSTIFFTSNDLIRAKIHFWSVWSQLVATGRVTLIRSNILTSNDVIRAKTRFWQFCPHRICLPRFKIKNHGSLNECHVVLYSDIESNRYRVKSVFKGSLTCTFRWSPKKQFSEVLQNLGFISVQSHYSYIYFWASDQE